MLKIADKNIKFGLNKNVNYYVTTSNSSIPKKIHQSASEALTHQKDNSKEE